MFLGSIMLIRSPFELVSISLTLIITTVLIAAVFFIWVIGLGLKAQQRKPTTGLEGMIGESGVTMTAIKPGSTGQVNVHGEIWEAVSEQGLKAGDQVVVESFEKFTLKVKSKE